MKPMHRTGTICVALALFISLPALACVVWAQEAGKAEKQEQEAVIWGTDAPRDTLIDAARAMIEEAHYCALITLDASGHPRARTMDAFPLEDDMVVWMGTSRLTRKVKEIRNDPRVTLYFAHPKHMGYVTIYGTAELVDDPAEKDERWNEQYAAYFSGGKESFILIAVTPRRMEITDYARGIMGDKKTWQPPAVTFPGD